MGELAVMGEPADTAAAQQTVMGDETDTGEQAAVGAKTDAGEQTLSLIHIWKNYIIGGYALYGRSCAEAGQG